MTDVFISYKSEDKPRAAIFATALEKEGLSVWWDADLLGGDIYDQVIERNLAEARVVIVLWSARSVASTWVRAEATVAANAEKLVPIMIEPCEPSLVFSMMQTIKLFDWTGDTHDANWATALKSIRAKLARHHEKSAGQEDERELHDQFWLVVDRSDDAKDLQEYLVRFPRGRHAAEVRRRLASRPQAPRPGTNAKPDSKVVDRPPPRNLAKLALIPIIFVLVISAGWFATTFLQTRAALTRSVAAHAANGQSFRDCRGCPQMIALSPGSYLIGSPADEIGRDADETPQTLIDIDAIAIGATEVTFEQWDLCVSAGGCAHRPDDGGEGRKDRPVVNVSWEDARTYARWLSTATGVSYRLPSEAEWEYAARAGVTGASVSTSAFCDIGNGADDTLRRERPDFQDSFACNDGAMRSAPVAHYRANNFGLFDMQGNVSEWVQDCWSENHLNTPPDGSARMGETCQEKTIRGGSWAMGPHNQRLANRMRDTKDTRRDTVGFRVVRDL